jgi:hypothetical protein
MTDEYTVYCAECEWTASTAEGKTRAAVTTAAIAHYTDVGHSPVRAQSYTPASRRLQPPFQGRLRLLNKR